MAHLTRTDLILTGIDQILTQVDNIEIVRILFGRSKFSESGRYSYLTH